MPDPDAGPETANAPQGGARRAALTRKWRSLRRQSAPTLLLIGPVWLLLGLAGLILRLVALKHLARVYGRDLGVGVWLPLATPAQESRARHIRAALGIAARYAPWRADCYPQALVARLLLGLARVPHAICFGLRREGGLPRAHAWVMAGRVPICGQIGGQIGGQDSFDRYTLVRAFVSA